MLQYSITGLPDNRTVKVITITYELALIHHSEQQRLVSVHNFIAQIGGNLGLFLGFSCLGTLFSFYSCVSQRKSNRKTEDNISNASEI